ncbi:Transmembrane protein 184 homolog C30D11,06c [Rhizoctonia solani AG-1 IB]|uniref:Transmembrane protein 184 homolog C30D11,06c n=1 Tax=Thanatephorus cucumeris (strain AG1-IB / isolate 7/3/14) TaxID=1108050 RepID=M5CFE8_THACB|nr:Transmembrane protein 184 homolog C30D11,06c [Rhizoctonia solani AG-1 IB]
MRSQSASSSANSTPRIRSLFFSSAGVYSVKPILAAVTLILKALGKYREGSFRVDAGYLYVSIVYNASICLSLYCLAMFWVCVSTDLKPFRPMPKFLCVKGILFFSFWQSICISLLVSVGVIKHIGSYTDVEHISLAITDTLICYEMPLFAIAHSYAFSTSDFTDPSVQHVARMPFLHALRDAFALLDVIVDARDTLRGGVSYQAYEPAEGGMHQGTGRDRRIRAGLRYAAGGRKKYWLPMPADDTTTSSIPTPGILTKARRAIEEQNAYAPLTDAQASQVVHSESSSSDSDSGHLVVPGAFDVQFESSRSLAIVRFRKSKREDGMYDDARKLVFGDYNYPVVDCSSERARERIWDAEEQILRDQRAAAFHPDLGGVVPHRLGGGKGYGATDANGKLGPRGVYGKWAADGDDEEEEEEDTGSIKSRGELEGGKISKSAAWT